MRRTFRSGSANNIRRLRLEAGYMQDVFAERAGINRTHMGQIERGEVNVTIQSLKLIADTLKLDVAELVRKPLPSEMRRGESLAPDVLDGQRARC